jgi:hypothetical protein
MVLAISPVSSDLGVAPMLEVIADHQKEVDPCFLTYPLNDRLPAFF